MGAKLQAGLSEKESLFFAEDPDLFCAYLQQLGDSLRLEVLKAEWPTCDTSLKIIKFDPAQNFIHFQSDLKEEQSFIWQQRERWLMASLEPGFDTSNAEGIVFRAYSEGAWEELGIEKVIPGFGKLPYVLSARVLGMRYQPETEEGHFYYKLPQTASDNLQFCSAGQCLDLVWKEGFLAVSESVPEESPALLSKP